MIERDKMVATKKRAKAAKSKVSNSSTTKDFNLTQFRREVYAWTRRIPRGKVATYSSIAAALGKPNASRAVGNALRTNPFAPIVPCHRVVAASTLHLNGYQGNTDIASGPLMIKAALLKQEGVQVVNDRVVATQLIQLESDPVWLGKALQESDLTEATLKLPSDVDMDFYNSLLKSNKKDVEVVELI